MRSARLLAPIAFLLSAVAFAFDGHKVSEGPLTVTIAEVPTATRFDAPASVKVTFANAGDAPLAVTLELRDLLPEFRAVGETRQQVTVPAHGQTETAFALALGRAAVSAHYPVHVYATFEAGGQTLTAHAVQVFETDFKAERSAAAQTAAPPLHVVPAAGAFALAALKDQQVTWAYVGEALVREPVGWSGSQVTSKASFGRGPITRGGETRPTLQMHPPYQPRAGTIFAEYRLRLPATTPLRLSFFNAIRDSTPREGTSDGVTFRVWAGDQKLFERHTDAKTWTAGEADLGAFAGREILLRLESHPGPKNNTTCDSSYWGDPVIVAGAAPRIIDAAGKTALRDRARQMLATGRPAGDGTLVYELAGGCRAAIVLGPNGLADAAPGFGDGRRDLFVDGFEIAVADQRLGAWPSGVIVERVEVATEPPGRTRIVHRLRLGEKTADLTATLWADGPGLRVKVECAEPITALGVGPFDQQAPRVYYGHGFCIVDPEPFRAMPGGHNLSTSHVGCDFERGVALLQASDTPVDFFNVNPPQRVYQLRTHPASTLTFVPGFAGAFDCALRYRPLFDKPAAPGVARKAGRFVFDLWGGRYADDTARLQRCFDYGLTDALVVMHVWQRWGYDYRLPDIFPPLPSLGTLAELRDLGRACTARGVLWGLHDNYIDFYPDATGFSYDHVTFTADGQPRRAWLMETRNAQSYQWRPDRIAPFLRRNLDLIVPALQPTTSFVDVFASINSFDYHDRDGNLHSKLETQRAWGEAFAAIRDACGNHAPTISEAGGDHLIGWLDGSDCQFMLINAKPERFNLGIASRDWERVPWFDAVNHTRFSLHGAGYSDRYQGGRSREEHGIESDDYLTAEILTGHALMIDLTALGRGAVRKYWLAQDFIASVARDEIAGVEFAGGDIHRLIVNWQSGARVRVNRGETDWTVAGRVLPQFGYLAQNGPIESSVERLPGGIAEQSRAPGKLYVNGRGFNPAAPLAIAPSVERIEPLGGRRFHLIVNWDAQRPAPADCNVFYHFSRPTPGRRALTEFTGGGRPTPGTSTWQGRVVTGTDWTITMPDDLPLGGYDILVGLVDPKNRGARQRLLGDEDPRRRYRLGRLIVEGDNRTGAVSGLRLERPAKAFVPGARWLANSAPVAFGPVTTAGACRVEVRPDHLVVTPLPDGDDFGLRLDVAQILGRRATVRSVEAVDAQGAPQRTVSHESAGTEISFIAAKSDFAYRVNLR
jgi:hypothetical protein